MGSAASGLESLQENSLILKEELLMNTNRFAKSVAVSAGFLFLFAVAGAARAYCTPAGGGQTPTPAMPGSQAESPSNPAEYFEGLEYTPEQKAQIDKIQHDAEMRKAAVAKDQKLDQEQKDAMLKGYTRLEYGAIFKVLTPEQQRQVREKVRAHQAAMKKNSPPKS
jgi:Spy/CpxP family protein refolding chaperone